MTFWRIKLSLFLNYFVIAMLLNSVGTVILQVQNTYGVSESSASVLEAFKDLSIALASFLVASYVARIGYKLSMLIALGLVGGACMLMPSMGSFAMTKTLFAVTGISFALIKVSVYATIGIVTSDKKEHASFMNFIESFFMIGILTGYFVFSAFVNDHDKQSTAWLNVYYLCAGIAFAAFFLLVSAPLNESSVKEQVPKPFLEDFADMVKLAAKPLVLIFIVSAFIYVLIEQSIMSWLPTFNSKVLQLPATLSIQMASILAASTALGRFSAGFALRKVNWFYVLVICLIAAAALVLIAIPLAQASGGHTVSGWHDAPLAAFVFPLIGLFIAPIYPAINSVILSSLPARQHGPMSGLIVIFSALGGTTGSIITGNMFQVFGGQTAFYFSLVPITILIVCLYFFNRIQKKTDSVLTFNASATH
ncbi:MAG: putative trehalose permease, MFS family, FucP subfamily [Cytophagales bacterium]|jgi:fucose permease|nr:MFS transporter [Bacteroidota bacterium]MBS1979630.1 MFS transporter [Bacteroidota bacterium]WHZ09169.1 MAG: putative trehalose permease, MFS family, FucP subfamily [Cytophagales bacterium]